MKKSNSGSIVRLLAQGFCIALLATSCVSTNTIKLSASDREAMKGKTFATTTRKMPEYGVLKQSAMAAASLGGAVGGAIAGNMAAREGAEQLAKHKFPNPNDTMANETASYLSSRTGMKRVRAGEAAVSMDPAEVASQNKHADYVLDCFTTGWMGTYYPFSLGKYFIMFGAKMQLVETSTGRVVAQGFNFYQGKDRANAPDYDGIYTNDAAFLRAETQKGTSGAVQKFKESL